MADMTKAPATPIESASKADDDLPATPLADLARLARERLGPEPDKAGPAATTIMAAVVRDLKGMPEITVAREATHRIRIGRRGKVGALSLEYHASIRAIELGYAGFPADDPTATKVRRYTFDTAEAPAQWTRIDGGGELIDDVKNGVLRLYPELGNR